MEPVLFNTNEFLTRLVVIFGDRSLAEQVWKLNEQYYYCLNLLPYNDWSDYFKTKEEFISFKQKNQIPDSINIYDPYKFEKILINTLDISSEKASEFTKCEEGYLKEIGAM